MQCDVLPDVHVTVVFKNHDVPGFSLPASSHSWLTSHKTNPSADLGLKTSEPLLNCFEPNTQEIIPPKAEKSMIQAESLPLSLTPSPLRAAPIKKGQTKHQYNTPPSPLLSTLFCLSSLPTRHSSQKASPRGIIGLWVSFLSPTFMTNTPKKTPHATYNPWPPPTRPTPSPYPSIIKTARQKTTKLCTFARHQEAQRQREARHRASEKESGRESAEPAPQQKARGARIGYMPAGSKSRCFAVPVCKNPACQKTAEKKKKCCISHVLILKAKKKTPWRRTQEEYSKCNNDLLGDLPVRLTRVDLGSLLHPGSRRLSLGCDTVELRRPHGHRGWGVCGHVVVLKLDGGPPPLVVLRRRCVRTGAARACPLLTGLKLHARRLHMSWSRAADVWAPGRQDLVGDPWAGANRELAEARRSRTPLGHALPIDARTGAVDLNLGDELFEGTVRSHPGVVVHKAD